MFSYGFNKGDIFQTLIVLFSAPPRWTVEPLDAGKHYAQGSDVKVDCKADGLPKPQISWKKVEGQFSSNKNISIILTKLDFYYTQNETLTII